MSPWYVTVGVPVCGVGPGGGCCPLHTPWPHQAQPRDGFPLTDQEDLWPVFKCLSVRQTRNVPPHLQCKLWCSWTCCCVLGMSFWSSFVVVSMLIFRNWLLFKHTSESPLHIMQVRKHTHTHVIYKVCIIHLHLPLHGLHYIVENIFFLFLRITQ